MGVMTAPFVKPVVVFARRLTVARADRPPALCPTSWWCPHRGHLTRW